MAVEPRDPEGVPRTGRAPRSSTTLALHRRAVPRRARRDGRQRRARAAPAAKLARYEDVENADWKFLVWDEGDGAPRMPLGSVGTAGREEGQVEPRSSKDGADGSEIDPSSRSSRRRRGRAGAFDDFAGGATTTPRRAGPVVETATDRCGSRRSTTCSSRSTASARGLPGDWPAGYDDDGGALHAGVAGEVHRHRPRRT